MYFSRDDESVNDLEAQRKKQIEALVDKIAPEIEEPTPIAERFQGLIKSLADKETRPKDIFELGAKATEALTEAGKVKGQPIYFDPTMMSAMGSVKKLGQSGAIERLGEKSPQII